MLNLRYNYAKMFNLFKQDIKIGDKVKLYLTTGKEPEGVVIEIGENYVLLQSNDKTQNRFFDKLIGGWDVIQSIKKKAELTVAPIEIEPTDSLIDKKFLIEHANLLLSSLNNEELLKISQPNAEIIEVHGTNYIAANNKYPKILILPSKIADNRLKSELKNFRAGLIVPVILSLTQRKGINIVNAVALPSSLVEYIKSFINYLEQSNFQQASTLLYIIRDEIKFNKYLAGIIMELKKIHIKPDDINKEKIIPTIKNPEKKAFKNVEKEINDLIRQSKFEFALSQIDKELTTTSIDDKYKSGLLLKKAQIYSSLNNPDASEKAYQELVNFNEKIKAPANNLSHLFTELARLQSLKVEKQKTALESVKKALFYNPNNNFATNLLKQFEDKTGKFETDINKRENDDELIIIEEEDDNGAISKMIDLDIKEHKYSLPEIIRNGGKPTAFIAKNILEEAKKTRDEDLSERYPLYLEAAKSFSELNVGSYDLRDYLESVAFYSMLKGNSLFINFKNRVLSGEIDIFKLTRLRDSACSYYIESLNLLSNIDPKLLLNILANYLEINIVLYYISNKISYDFKKMFKGYFIDILTFCLRNENSEIGKIAYKTIVDCGVASINAWNRLYSEPKGTAVLFSSAKQTQDVFELINEIEGNHISISYRPSDFLKSTFLERRKKVNKFTDSLLKLSFIELEPHLIENITTQWTGIADFEKFLTPTDNETKREIDRLLSILQPYLNRGQSERTNILIQARKIIEKQLKFINDNTTFYGRTFFYGLLNKWKREVDFLLEEKIAQSYPSLAVIIDPPYYIETNGEFSAPLIIKNEGEATAEGFSLTLTLESTEYEDSVQIPYEKEIEIAAAGKIELSFAIPSELLSETKAVEISINIQAIYQKKKLTPRLFQFTVEEEPLSRLTYDDIPWRDGPIPPEHLFKGRKKLIADLAQHYTSVEKDKPYILYGLTRTGKSSILEYLRKNLEGDTFFSQGKEKRILTFKWELNVAASYKKASDFWNYTLFWQTYTEIEKFSVKYNFNREGITLRENNVRAKDFKIILDYLESKDLYPLFLIDEFSFIKTLIDDGTVNAAFLHTLRQYSLDGQASFIFAGTYDIKALIKDPTYGITGQLVHAIEEQINEISNEYAEELMDVINDKLSFTPEAIEHIKFLSGNVPYFIQIICKFCGYYASENKRRYIGYPELEKVIRILIGQDPPSINSFVKKLPEFTFQNNQYSPTDPKEVAVLVSSISFFNKDKVNDPRGVSFAELQKLWADKKITAFRQRLAETIQLLMDKKILIQEEDEGTPVYKLSVDIFRRWWSCHNQDINLTLTTLT